MSSSDFPPLPHSVGADYDGEDDEWTEIKAEARKTFALIEIIAIAKDKVEWASPEALQTFESAMAEVKALGSDFNSYKNSPDPVYHVQNHRYLVSNCFRILCNTKALPDVTALIDNALEIAEEDLEEKDTKQIKQIEKHLKGMWSPKQAAVHYYTWIKFFRMREIPNTLAEYHANSDKYFTEETLEADRACLHVSHTYQRLGNPRCLPYYNKYMSPAILRLLKAVRSNCADSEVARDIVDRAIEISEKKWDGDTDADEFDNVLKEIKQIHTKLCEELEYDYDPLWKEKDVLEKGMRPW